MRARWPPLNEVAPISHAGRKSAFLLLALCMGMPGSLSAQERAMVPLTIDGEPVRLATITYKPTGNGPFPTLIFHHGSTGSGRDPALFAGRYDPRALANWFTARGWAVILPSRRGLVARKASTTKASRPIVRRATAASRRWRGPVRSARCATSTR